MSSDDSCQRCSKVPAEFLDPAKLRLCASCRSQWQDRFREATGGVTASVVKGIGFVLVALGLVQLLTMTLVTVAVRAKGLSVPQWAWIYASTLTICALLLFWLGRSMQEKIYKSNREKFLASE